MNVVIASITGSIIGLVVASIVRPPYPYFKFTIVQIGIGTVQQDWLSSFLFTRISVIMWR